MNVNVLIDSIVRQTMVLIAQLATSAGVRAPLAHTANQVFLDLARELKEQGLGNKVIADMFGIALRTYHSKVRRLSESRTDSGSSLWEGVLTFIHHKQTVLRSDVLQRFSNDDRAMVCGVLKDLVDSGIVFSAGRGERTTYRAATPEEYRLADREGDADGLAHMLWVAINRQMPVTAEELARTLPIEARELDACLKRLEADGRIRVIADQNPPEYECETCVIPLGASAGWEAAVFDHYQAMVTAICSKITQGERRSSTGDTVGGSTYGYDIWPGHPHYDEVLNLLATTRTHAVDLRSKVESFNRAHFKEALRPIRVLYYAGQTLLGPDEPGEDPTS